MHSRLASGLDQVYTALYAELRGLAESALRCEKVGHTLQPTALAHEAYLRLSEQHSVDWGHRRYFLSAASSVIQRVLVDHARTKGRSKRGRGWARTSFAGLEAPASRAWDLLDLDEALGVLESLNDRHATVVRLRFFGGLDNQEIASVLGVSTRTVNTDWRVARAWLQARLGGAESGT